MNQSKASDASYPKHPAAKPEQSLTGKVICESRPKLQKPTGAVIYTIEKGADVWPKRK